MPTPHDPHSSVPLDQHQPHPDVEAAGATLAGPPRVLTGAAALAAAGLAAPAFADDDLDELGDERRGNRRHRVRVTVLGTTDSHGNVFNWDYFKNKEYDDSAHNDIGLAKIHTLVKAA